MRMIQMILMKMRKYEFEYFVNVNNSKLQEEDELSKSQASIKSRPMSGKEARQQRSAKIRAALVGNEPLEADK